MTALFLAAMLAGAAAAAGHPEGEPAGGGSQRLALEALRLAHGQFSGDACLAGVEVTALRAAAPKGPRDDRFSFRLRSPSLWKMRLEARICVPDGPRAPDGPCSGEWELHQDKPGDKEACLKGPLADSAEALLVARRKGLPVAPLDGIRLALRALGKAGPLVKAKPKLKGRNVWIVESREECHVVDAATLEHWLKGACGPLGLSEKYQKN